MNHRVLMPKVKVRTDSVELGKIPITWINVSIIQKTSTVSPVHKKAPLGGSKHTQGSEFRQKEKQLSRGNSDANCELNNAVYILRQKTSSVCGW